MAAEILIQLVQQHGVLAVMGGMVIEEVLVPLPSPVIPMAAGAFVLQANTLSAAALQALLIVALPGSIASVLSSYFVYSIAFYGGKPAIKSYGKLIDVKWEEVKHLESHFDSGKEGYYVAFFRAVPIVPLSLVSGSAGLFRMDWKRYGIWSFIGMIPRNFSLAMIGWYVKDDFVRIASKIDTLSTAVAVTVAAVVGIVILYRKSKDLYRWIIIKS